MGLLPPEIACGGLEFEYVEPRDEPTGLGLEVDGPPAYGEPFNVGMHWK